MIGYHAAISPVMESSCQTLSMMEYLETYQSLLGQPNKEYVGTALLTDNVSLIVMATD